MTQTDKRKAGRPKGIGREGTYGTGVSTKVRRVPAHLADKIGDIIGTLDTLQAFVHAWEKQIENSQTSPRYEQAKIMLDELKDILDILDIK